MKDDPRERVEFPRRGVLVMWSWGGETRQPVEIIGETPKRFRIKAIHRTKIGGRDRWLEQGETALVPKGAIAEDATHG